MTRKTLMRQFSFSIIPPNAYSINLLKNNTLAHKKNFYLGGRLKAPISASQFTLSTSNYQVQVKLNPDCQVFLDFQKQKSFKWQKIFSLLKPNDSVFIYQHTLKKNHSRYKLKSAIVILSALVESDNISPLPLNIKWQKKWFLFIQKVHQILLKKALQPVETPSLVTCPGVEADLEVFKTTQYHAGKKQSLFLPTSPEISLKKLLCQGFTDFYEIKKCFRNNELGPLNTNEFYLLEWYRSHTNWLSVMEDIEHLLHSLAKWYQFTLPRLQKITMEQLFKKYLNFNLTPASSKQDFARQLKKMSIPLPSKASIDDLFYLLFLNGIEKHLKTPTIVYNYPPFQRAYARLDPRTGWARRFELYWKTIELANGFDEITCHHIQKKQFQIQLLKRKQKQKTPIPMDKQLLQNMKQLSMPPSVGVALGLERLFMIFNKLKDIQQIRCVF